MNRIGARLRTAAVEVVVASPRARSPVESDRPSRDRARRDGSWWALGVWAGAIVAAHVVLVDLVQSGAHVRIPFPPLDAALDWRPGWELLLPAAVAVGLVARGHVVTTRASWRGLLVASTVVAGVWAVALALLDGTAGLVGSVTLKNEYLPDVGRVGAPLEFLRGFTTHLAEYRIHVQGHPPGYLLVLSFLDRIGIANAPVVAALEILGGVLAVPAVLIAVREVAGETTARAAWPYVAAAPIAIWVATSADALYAGIGAWAVTLVVVATGRADRRGDLCAVAGGVLFGALAFLSYGLVLLAVIPCGIAFFRRRARPILLAALGASFVFAAFALAGFWWFAGLAATRARYHAGVASRRPYDVFLLVNLAALAIATGPAIAVALARLRDRRIWWIVGGALAAIGIADAHRDVEGRGRTDLVAVLDLAAARRRGARGRSTPFALVGGAACLRHRRADPGAKPVVILVTGGAGFVGSFVVEQLCDLGHEVRVLDRLHPGAHDGVPADLDPRAEWIWGDCADGEVVARVVAGVDAVCHQAAMVGLGVDLGDAPAYVRDNDLGTAVLLAGLHGIGFSGRLVLASSMVVYGEGGYRCVEHGDVRPAPRTRSQLDAGEWEPRCPDCGSALAPVEIDESAAVDPRNVYAATKLHQEHLCAAYGREHAATVVALRYHNVYGPRMPRDTPYAGVASIFRSALEAGRPPTVFEDGGQLRDFVHVTDVARANVAALTVADPRPGAYNVASGERRTILDMARAIADGHPGGGAAPVVVPRYRLGDVRHVFGATAGARRSLGFVAETPFATGMREFATAPLRHPGGGPAPYPS